MNTSKVFFLANVVTLWACFAGPFFAFATSHAQSNQQGISLSNEIKLDVKQQLKKEKNGDVLIVVFKDGLPAEGVVVKTQSGVFTTDSSGVISVSLPATRQKVEIASTGQEVDVTVVANEEVQMTVHLLESRKSETEVNSPQATAVQVEKNTPQKDLKMQVMSREQRPIADATVLFSGLDKVYKTDAEGRLNARLAEGQYSMSVFHPNYQTKTIADLKVNSEIEPLSVELKAAQNELEEVVVLAPKIKGSLSALVEIRKQSSAVTDVLGAEQMARAGDSDAAASLRRVTGLTLVAGKYVYVRGLGERYSGVQMNGFSLPSPEPSRRVVPLDLFPTSIMESIVVQKSYSPDLPGEFGGGIIQLKTRSLPEKFFFRGNVGFAYENVGNRLEHQGGSTDWLGIDDGTRKMSAVLKNALEQGKEIALASESTPTGVTQNELIQMGASLPKNYDFSREDTPSMPSLSISMGDGWKFGKYKIGNSGSVMYGQNTDQLQRVSKTYGIVGGVFVPDSTRVSEISEVETRVAGSYEIGLDITEKHRLVANTFLLRNTTKLTQIDNTTSVGTNPVETYTADFTERQLWTRHFKGEHELFKIFETPIQADWRLGWADAKRDSPGRLALAYSQSDPTEKTLLGGAVGNLRTYSELVDDSQERALNFTIPIQKADSDFLKIKLGVWQIDKKRVSDIYRFSFRGNCVGTASECFSNDEIQKGTVSLQNITNAADNYVGTQTIDAQYLMADFSPLSSISIIAGVRRETSDQVVNTFKYSDRATPSSFSTIQMNDVLPSYGLVWKPTEKIRSRITYSETLARPDFREMSEVGFVDDETGNIVQGNSNLKGTVIKNIDHRWEYYFSSDEYASIGFFYKEFQNPIEVVFYPGVNNIQTFENSKAATNFGIEFEGRVGLRHFSRPLRRWTVLSNVTFIESEIELSETSQGIQTSKSRPLQGQSPYVVNMQLQYDRPQWGLSTTLLYNVVGKRITEVGTNTIPDTYEQPFGQLDLVATQRVDERWTVSLRARNLLNPEVESTQGEEMVRSFRRGRVFGLVLGAVF